jgi:hypothetical protein
MTHANLQERLELADDPVHKLRKLMDKWKDRLAPNNLRFAERYLKGEIEIRVHYRPVKQSAEGAEFCAIFKNLGIGGVVRHLEGDVSRITCGSSELKEAAHVPESNNQQEAVFVEVVELVEFQEVIAPALVRLNRVDEAYRSCAHSLYLSRSSGYVIGRSLVNRKAGILGRCLPVSLNELPSQVIERAAEVVNNISEDQRKRDWRAGDDFCLESIRSGLRIALKDKSVRIGITEQLASTIELADVVIGPFDFCVDADEPVCCGGHEASI